MLKEVRVRNAPSPTGFLHIGGIRTFLYNYLFARKNNGKYILRIEDTDQARLIAGSLENIVQSLADLGISADEGPYWDNGLKTRGDKGPYVQSERLDLYKKYAQELVDKKFAYYCFCSAKRLEELRNDQEAKKFPPKYDKRCLNLSPDEIAKKISSNESHVIRLNVQPDQMIEFHDLVYGDIKISSNEIDDQILLKSDGFPTYHLAVVVDDYLMQISHVIRANEWIPSTPKHILLYKAFGWDLPEFVHLPPILSKKTGKKLAKREGDVAVAAFLEKGYLPAAIINFLALLGWNPKTEQEIFSLTELVNEFSFDKLHKSGAIFDLDKLDWFNSVYIRKLKIDELLVLCLPYLIKAGIKIDRYPKNFIQKILTLEQERLKKLSEIGDRVKYFFQEQDYEAQLLIWKKTDKQTILKNLNSLQKFLQSLPGQKFAEDALEQEIKKFLEEKNIRTGEALWPLRVALTGLEASPGPFEIMDAFGILPDGKEIILQRINKAIEKLF